MEIVRAFAVCRHLEVARQFGSHAKLIQCLSGGGLAYDTAEVLDNPKYRDVGLYGFAPWPDPKTTLPPDPPQDAGQKNIRSNIEKLRKAYRGPSVENQK